MKLLKRLVPILCTISGTLFAQLSTVPVLITPPGVQYPPIARAAHVEGEVVVNFSIDSEGRTDSVQTVSGPEMLRHAVEDQVRQWRFQVPLPMNAQQDFKADYKFTLQSAEDLEDDLDDPPYIPCCGDSIILPSGAHQVTGEVRSLDGSQTIDITHIAAEPQKDPCPGDKERQPPSTTDANDFVELYRTACEGDECNYRVRVYRYGIAEWYGKEGVADTGDRSISIAPEAVAALFANAMAKSYWLACSILPPPADQDVHDENFYRQNFVTVSIDGHIKSTNTDSSVAEKLAWAVDKAADMHRWRHGDSAVEPCSNMRSDLMLPKPGMTALIRATYRFNPGNAQQTWEPLKRLITAGADVNAADESGWTALMYVAQLDTSNDQPFHLLLDAHAEVNRASLHGDTALMMAAYNGTLSRLLLAAGADINAHNADGVTALMLLAQRDVEQMRAALAAGADAAAQDNEGRTALDYLHAASCHKQIVPLPKGWDAFMEMKPSPCPSNDEAFLKAQALLEAAMKKHSSPLP